MSTDFAPNVHQCFSKHLSTFSRIYKDLLPNVYGCLIECLLTFLQTYTEPLTNVYRYFTVVISIRSDANQMLTICIIIS